MIQMFNNPIASTVRETDQETRARGKQTAATPKRKIQQKFQAPTLLYVNYSHNL
jgi:hypothetical protein